MNVELVQTRTSDGLRLDGALHIPSIPPQTSLEAIIFLHGVGSNFYGSTLFDHVCSPLTELGASFLSVNTRGHDGFFVANSSAGRRNFGAAYEIVDECLLDIAAWTKLLAERGIRRTVLLGHSLGAIKALYSQAKHPDESVTGVIALSPPRLSYTCFQSGLDSDAFFESMSTAQKKVNIGQGGAVFQARFPYPLLISASSFVDKYGPEERYNIMKFANQLQCPALVTFGQSEVAEGGIAFAGVPEALEALPLGGQPFSVKVIPRGDHHYTGVQAKLAEHLVRWLIELR